MWFISDEDVAIEVEYEVEGEYVVPSAATYSLRDHSGVELTSGALSAALTHETVEIDAAHSAITGLWENRYLTVTFVADGKTHRKTTSYHLSAFVPLTVGPEDVRSTLGLDQKELLDQEIQIEEVYFRLVETYGSAFSDATLLTGIRNWAANRCVVLKAALDVAQSLPMRTRISIRTEDTTEKRTEKIDFAAIVKDLEIELAAVTNTAIAQSVVAPTLFTLSSPTDAITG